jgi:thiol-disulfide isomerase/thioredoxin
MCTCIKDIEKERKKILEYIQKKKANAKIISTQLHPTLLLLSGKTDRKTYSILEVTIEGQKKPIEVNFYHSFCPFCGKKNK